MHLEIFKLQTICSLSIWSLNKGLRAKSLCSLQPLFLTARIWENSSFLFLHILQADIYMLQSLDSSSCEVVFSENGTHFSTFKGPNLKVQEYLSVKTKYWSTSNLWRHYNPGFQSCFPEFEGEMLPVSIVVWSIMTGHQCHTVRMEAEWTWINMQHPYCRFCSIWAIPSQNHVYRENTHKQ